MGRRRQALVAQLVAATTPDEHAAAKAAVITWMREHPTDIGILRVCQMLGIGRQRPAHLP